VPSADPMVPRDHTGAKSAGDGVAASSENYEL
jgi:hypothetical protein